MLWAQSPAQFLDDKTESMECKKQGKAEHQCCRTFVKAQHQPIGCHELHITAAHSAHTRAAMSRITPASRPNSFSGVKESREVKAMQRQEASGMMRFGYPIKIL